ncbi:MAG: hypothetical protein WCB12_00290 [Bryobacteraceae bacterium]
MDVFHPCRRTFHLFAAAILACGIATADTIVANIDTSLGEENALWLNIPAYNGGPGADTELYFAGVLEIQLTNSNGTVDRDTMCVDLFTDIYVGQAYGTSVDLPSQVLPPQSPAALEQIAWLLDNVTPTTPEEGAALQVAIWKIEVDGGGSFTTGQVQQPASSNDMTPITQAVLSDAQAYLSASVGQSSDSAFVYENVSLSDGSPAQTLEGLEFLDNGPQPAPESSTFVLAGVALLALGRTARRKLGSR